MTMPPVCDQSNPVLKITHNAGEQAHLAMGFPTFSVRDDRYYSVPENIVKCVYGTFGFGFV
jgi:hypothetical protein